MYKEQLIAWSQSKGIKYSISGNEMKTQCLNPEHMDDNPSFSINVVTGLAYCFSCQYKTHANRILNIQPGDDDERLSKYLTLKRQWDTEEEEQEEVLQITLPPKAFDIVEDIRGIPKEMLKELGVYYCNHGKYMGRLIFPIRDTKGQLLGFDARIYGEYGDEPTPKYAHAKYLRPYGMRTANVLYPLDYLWSHRDDLDLSSVVLTEGIFDALSYIALGIPSVCNFGLGTPSAYKVAHLFSLGCQEIINGLDGDQPSILAWQGDIEKGRVGLKEIWRQQLRVGKTPPEVQKVKSSGYKDANEYLCAAQRHA